jgi:hypothetical protein
MIAAARQVAGAAGAFTSGHDGREARACKAQMETK